MGFENEFSQIAVLLGDRSRSIMLWNLLDGRAYTATELSLCAEISPQSASNHLSKLTEAKILIVEKQGRHRYYKYVNAEIAQVIESMASLIPLSQEIKRKEEPEPVGIKYARTCYDHLAGKIGVDITEALINKGMLLPIEKRYQVSPIGVEWFLSFGINVEELKIPKRSFAHQCLDWSERKHHLAGALGASMLNKLLKNDWIRRKQHSREILLTPIGKMSLRDKLGLVI